MTISELRDHLAKYCGEGKGDAPLLVCDMRDNPINNIVEIDDILFMEWKDGECRVVLQTQ